MNFRSGNKFNVIINAISGNFLPLSEEKKKFNLGKASFAIFIWLVDAVYVTSGLIGGMNYVPVSIAFEEGCVLYIAVVELIIITIYLNTRREHLRNLIRKVNAILIDSAHLRRCIDETVEPNKKYLKLYTVAAVGAVFGWASLPIFKVFKQNRFTYVDYTLTAYMPGEPFSVKTFLLGVFFQIISSCYCALRKVSIDIYISYLVTLLTAQFKYVREQIALALHREDNSEIDEKLVISALKKCIEHHGSVIEAGQMLIELMAVHVGLTYINSIMRFSFVGYSILLCTDDSFKRFMISGYGAALLIQLFMLCSCAQDMLEASTSITDDAFHEDWHGHSVNVKKIFSTIEHSNHMERRMSAYRIVDLARPTVVLILNKAYSACLLLQRIK